MNIKLGISELVENKDISKTDINIIMREIMQGNITPAQFGSFVTALRIKGETPEEIAGMAEAMREFSEKIITKLPVIDTCGTGGDGKKWFNISTAVSFVVAGAGIPVAKHGNRAMSGSSGSADVLEVLGVNIMLDSSDVKKCLEEIGIGFMFAQKFHPAMKFAGPLRPEIGIRTIFNLLGPLTNPANAKKQIIGTVNTNNAEKIAKALKILDTENSMVLNSNSGADEIDIEGNTTIFQVTKNTLKRRRTRPADFGLPEGKSTHLISNSSKESAKIILDIFDGSGSDINSSVEEISRRNCVIINSAAAILVSGLSDSFQDAAMVATDSIDSGSAKLKLNNLIDITTKMK